MMNFDNLFNYSLYCQYKDLEGVYCDSCRKWLIYGEKTENKPFYIVSDKLIACPDCITIRNGHYPYLSDFSMFRKGFLKCNDKKLKQEILSVFRSNGKERFLKKYILKSHFYGDRIHSSRGLYGDKIILRNKFKNYPDDFINCNYKDEIVGYTCYLNPHTYFNAHLCNILKEIIKIQNERPMMKYIVIKEFGTYKEKKKLYEFIKQLDSILEHTDFEMFYDEFGLHYIQSLEDSIFNDSILNSVDQKELPMLMKLCDDSLHWSEKMQHYFKRYFYKPKRFNVHKLGYY